MNEANRRPAAPGRSGEIRRRALLVEDNEVNLTIAEVLLKSQGLDVDEARNGEEAVRRFAASAPGTYAFIFMDIVMPVMDGLEATRQIRRLSRPDAQTVPVIAMSADAFPETVRRSLRAGMNACLAKPLDVEKLRETIRGLPLPRAGDGTPGLHEEAR